MLEGYFNNSETGASPLQDRLVMALLKTVMESTDVLMKKPDDYDARANLMWSAILGFNGLPTAGMGRVLLPAHMIEHSLSALYDLPHGAGLSIILPAWMFRAAATKTARLAAFARDAFGIAENEDATAARLGTTSQAWFAAIGSHVSLGEVQIPLRP
jgi:alcohol dehydrogenase YqhD (iron-dependent ADH family)